MDSIHEDLLIHTYPLTQNPNAGKEAATDAAAAGDQGNLVFLHVTTLSEAAPSDFDVVREAAQDEGAEVLIDQPTCLMVDEPDPTAPEEAISVRLTMSGRHRDGSLCFASVHRYFMTRPAEDGTRQPIIGETPPD